MFLLGWNRKSGVQHLINFWKIQEWDGMRKQGLFYENNSMEKTIKAT